MIRSAVIEAVRMALRGRDRAGYLHHTHVMFTSRRWSSL